MQRRMLISDICRALKLQYEGSDIEINGLNLCNRISGHDRIISYVTSTDYVDAVRDNPSIVCLLVTKSDYDLYRVQAAARKFSYIVCDNSEKLFYDIHDYLYYNTDFYEKYSFPAKVGSGCEIHPSAVVEDGVIIGNNVVIGANTVVRRGTIIEDNCQIGCNNTIGSEGFQILRIDGKNRKIVHVGGLRISEHVFIGDNNTVCNSLFEGETYIGKNAKIDNLIHVGHNGYVGDNAVVTAGTILCGSSRVESDAWIGVNSSVLNRVIVGNASKVGIGSVVTRDIPEGPLAYGVPATVKILFGGGRGLGAEILKWLVGLEWVDIASVCPIPEELDGCYAKEIRQIIHENHLKESTIEEIAEEKFDLGLSVNYHKIIPAHILENCQKGFFNVHHSYNLRLKGRNITTHAILNSRKEEIYYHGTTLHKMVPELDAGPIVASYACSIEEDDTAFSLFQKVDRLAFEMVKEWFPRIALQKVYLYPVPEEGIHSYRERDLPPKEIPIDILSAEEIYDYVRAFDFTGKEPAYIIKDSKKKRIVLKEREGFREKTEIKGRCYYSDGGVNSR